MNKQFTVEMCRWFDRLNGNTYHSVRCTRHTDGAVVVGPLAYRYGGHYKHTALHIMHNAGWFGKSTDSHSYPDDCFVFRYERENNYPIIWTVSDGLKRDCVTNGVL